MTTKELNDTDIIESNMIIAKFIGWDFDGVEYTVPEKFKTLIPFDYKSNKETCINCFETTLYRPENLKFHYSWDWIIESVKTMQSNIPIKFRVKNIGPLVTWENRLQTAMWQGIDRLYVEVVEFIKWYNEHK